MKNIVLLALSTLPQTVISKDFSYQNENEEIKIENCKYQLEPIPRLIQKLNPNAEMIIIALCTDKTVDVDDKRCIDGEDYTALEYFKERLNVSCGLEENHIVDIELDLDNPNVGICEAINQIKKEYDENTRLWIDTHGGLRDVAQIFSAIVSLLKVYSIVPEDILGVEVGKDLVKSQKAAFEIFEYVTGMNDFIHFGDAEILKKYYAQKEDVQIQKILESMNAIAEGTQLCDPNRYCEGIRELRSALQNKVNDPLMKVFMDYIRSDYGKVLLPKCFNEDDPIPALAILNRCVKKGLYQQALTFLESLMPEEYVNKWLLYAESSEDNKILQYRTQERKDYLSKEHFLFDSYVANVFIYYNKQVQTALVQQNNGDKDIIYKEAIERLSQFYTSKLQNSDFFNGEPNQFKRKIELKNLSYKEKSLNQNVTINMRSNCVDAENCLGEFGRLLQMHRALKNCRNLFNHSNPNRPRIEDIENALKLYIIYAQKVLDYDEL